MTLDRRTLLDGFATAAVLAPLFSLQQAMAQTPPPGHATLADIKGLKMMGDEQVAMLLYPGFTALDLVGPHFFFGGMMGARVHLVTTGADLKPVPSDLGLAIAPTVTLADCPRDLTLLFAPGGTAGTIAAASDPRVRAFFRERAERARFVTSVCTGAIILGASGLLKGKRATSHWAARETLPHFGATAVDERVVIDGKIITGAGVSAGLDFALAVVEVLRGRPYAQALMLQAEYAPRPPFAGGTVATTDPTLASAMRDMLGGFAQRALTLPVDA